MLKVYDKENMEWLHGEFAKQHLIKKYQDYLKQLKSPYGLELYRFQTGTDNYSRYLNAINHAEMILEKLESGYYDDKEEINGN